MNSRSSSSLWAAHRDPRSVLGSHSQQLPTAAPASQSQRNRAPLLYSAAPGTPCGYEHFLLDHLRPVAVQRDSTTFQRVSDLSAEAFRAVNVAYDTVAAGANVVASSQASHAALQAIKTPSHKTESNFHRRGVRHPHFHFAGSDASSVVPPDFDICSGLA